nr:hypothetical protein [Candidatus Sigynarchaeota archaeon]
MKFEDGLRKSQETNYGGAYAIRTEMPLQEGTLFVRAKNVMDSHCKGCKFNVFGEGLGCFGKIVYPIPKDFEFILAKFIENNANDFLNFIDHVKNYMSIEDNGTRNLYFRHNPNAFEQTEEYSINPGGRGSIPFGLFWDALFFPWDLEHDDWITYSRNDIDALASLAEKILPIIKKKMDATPEPDFKKLFETRKTDSSGRFGLHVSLIYNPAIGHVYKQFYRFFRLLVIARDANVNFNILGW